MEHTLTKFEVAMVQIFHKLYGSDTRTAMEQAWWKDIQDLKKAAQGEIRTDILVCRICGTEIRGECPDCYRSLPR